MCTPWLSPNPAWLTKSTLGKSGNMEKWALWSNLAETTTQRPVRLTAQSLSGRLHAPIPHIKWLVHPKMDCAEACFAVREGWIPCEL